MRRVLIALAALLCAAAPGALAKPDCRPTAEAPHLAYAILFFLPDSAVLAPGQRSEIDRLAERARICWPKSRLLVVGHVDVGRSYEYALAISERLAVAVRAALIARGIAAARVRTMSAGKGRPILRRLDPRNNRVEIIVERE